jgi:hypothetical protein
MNGTMLEVRRPGQALGGTPDGPAERRLTAGDPRARISSKCPQTLEKYEQDQAWN